MQRVLTIEFVNQDEYVVDSDGEDQEWYNFRNDQGHSHSKKREKTDK